MNGFLIYFLFFLIQCSQSPHVEKIKPSPTPIDCVGTDEGIKCNDEIPLEDRLPKIIPKKKSRPRVVRTKKILAKNNPI